MILVLGVILFFLFLSWFKPDLAFWIALTFYFDPGGYLEFYLYPGFQGAIKPSDVLLFFMFLPLISPRIKVTEILKDTDFIKLIVLLGFVVIYFIIVYGALSSEHDLSSYLRQFIVKRRQDIFGLVGLVPVYIFTIRGTELFFRILAFTSVIIPLFYFFGITFNLDLIPIVKMARYSNEEVIRYSMLSTGLMPTSIYLSFLGIFLGLKKSKLISFIFIGGVLMIISTLLTLTKTTIIFMLVQFGILFIVGLRIRPSRLSGFLRKASLGVFIVVLIILVWNQNLVDNLYRLSTDVIAIFNSGEDSSGTKFGRFGLELPAQMKMFTESPIFGTGHTDYWYTKDGDRLGYGASDTPYIAAFAMYGIVGVMVWLSVYFIIIRKSFRMLSVIIKSRNSYLLFLRKHQLMALLPVCFISQIMHSVLLQPNLLFVHFVRFEYLFYLLILFTMALAIFARYRKFSYTINEIV